MWLKRVLIGAGIVLALLIALVFAVGYWTAERAGRAEPVRDGRPPHRHHRRPL